jgi:2-methylisocitrate lyase-like PEP mutase family enzyme
MDNINVESIESKVKKTTRLKNLLIPGEPLICPGAYDAISAIAIEQSGFKALQVTGFGLAGSILGVPDVGILSMSQMVDATKYICQSVSIPVMTDGDTGFGNAVNTYYAVKAFEDAGAAGINLEDQLFPKRCGHMEGKMVISMEEMVGKIKAAVAARRDNDFVINARTDAGTLFGIDEAVKRGKAYADAGADMIFLEAPKINNKDDIKHAVREIGIPISIGIVLGGKAPVLTYEEYAELGLSRLSFPVAPLMASLKGLELGLKALAKNKTFLPEDYDLYTSFKDYLDFIDLPKIKELEEKFLPNAEMLARYENNK